MGAGHRRRHGSVVMALSLHAVAPGSNPIVTSGLDLFPVAPIQLYHANWLPPASWGS